MLRDGGIQGVSKSSVEEQEVEGRRVEYKESLEKTRVDLEEEKHRKNEKRKVEKENKKSKVANNQWKSK